MVYVTRLTKKLRYFYMQKDRRYLSFYKEDRKQGNSLERCKAGVGVQCTATIIHTARLYKGFACYTPFNFTLTRITLNQLSFS